eukprot:4020175-Karenia_brevis.AAC.1
MASQPHSMECRRGFEDIVKTEAKVRNQSPGWKNLRKRRREGRRRKRVRKRRVQESGLGKKVKRLEELVGVEAKGKKK